MAQDTKELAKRIAALGFAAVYMHTHQLQRDSSLRVAYLAYRFLSGDDVKQINDDADRENDARESVQHQPRVPRFLRVLERK